MVSDQNGVTTSVKPQQVTFIVPGITNFDQTEISNFLQKAQDNLDPAWIELVERNKSTTVEELAEMIFGSSEPLESYSAHLLLSKDDIYFTTLETKGSYSVYGPRSAVQVEELTQRKHAKDAAERELEEFVNLLKSARDMPLHAKPPKSVWSSEEKNWTKIESLKAYAIDNFINEDEKRTAGMKIEDAMRNFLCFIWKSDISQRNTSCSVSRAHVCSPLDKWGLGVRWICLANNSFICKLAWDILCNRSTDMALLHSRYISAGGRPHNSGRPSSIGPGIRRHLGRLVAGSRWTVGHSLGISSWNDNWQGYIISEKIGIPPSFAVGLGSTIRDYFYDEIWHFDYEFFMKHTDIVSIHVSRGSNSRVWGSSVSGQLTSKMAYDILRSPNPQVN
ncbi:hypothetical protein ACS0TY_027046 [Phlomoides rotata]